MGYLKAHAAPRKFNPGGGIGFQYLANGRELPSQTDTLEVFQGAFADTGTCAQILQVPAKQNAGGPELIGIEVIVVMGRNFVLSRVKVNSLGDKLP